MSSLGVACAVVAAGLVAGAPAASASSGLQKAGLHWSKPTHVGHNGIDALACPSTSLCVAGSSDGLLVSSDPAGDASTWNLVVVPPASGNAAPQVTSVSCPSASFCAAATLNGDLLTSSDPSGGPTAWQLTRLHLPVGQFPNIHQPLVSCASAFLCVAIAQGAHAVFSTGNPAGGPDKWGSDQLGHGLETVACTAPHLCLLGDDHGDVRTSTNPTGGARTWSFAHIFGRPGAVEDLDALACASGRYCIVAAIAYTIGVLVLATDPTGTKSMTPGAWQDQVASDPNGLFLSGSCVGGGFCAYAAEGGTVYFPTRSFRTLTHTRVDRPPRQNLGSESISCTSRHWCALGSGDGNLYIGTG